jgi:hypothetical protein
MQSEGGIDLMKHKTKIEIYDKNAKIVESEDF